MGKYAFTLLIYNYVKIFYEKIEFRPQVRLTHVIDIKIKNNQLLIINS